MATKELLRRTVADFLKVGPEALAAGSPLSGRRLQSSISRAALDAAIRRALGVSCPAVYRAKTYGELEAAVFGGQPADAAGAPAPPGPAPSPPATVALPAAAGQAGIACGMDLELVENLPEADDYWAHPFYQANFSATEIAYCSLQQTPRLHFAARWCAKEALKKCDSSFLPEAMSSLELVSGPAGPPTLRRVVGGAAQVLPFAVSVSHTPVAAAAVVLRLPAAGERWNASSALAPRLAAAPGRAPAPVNVWPVLLSVFSIALAAWALLRTWGF
jgi:phosphopantetheine--protein transferase-like protein